MNTHRRSLREGLSRRTRRHRSLAIGVAAQFEFTLRQIDVIGEWESVDHVEELPAGTIINHGQVWRPALRFEDIVLGISNLTTSKNDAKATVDVTAYPLFIQA